MPSHFVGSPEYSCVVMLYLLFLIRSIAGCLNGQFSRWTSVAVWRWDSKDDTCGICRMTFDGKEIQLHTCSTGCWLRL